MVIKTKYLNRGFHLVLPILIIVSQWISFRNLNLSWLIYLIMTFIVIIRLKLIFKNRALAIIIFLTTLLPPLNMYFSIAEEFNISLYLSICSGLVCLLYIYSLRDDTFRFFLYGCGIACIFFAFIGLYEIFQGNYLFYGNQNYFARHLNPFGQHYPVAAFPNTNDLSQFLVLLTPCCLLLLKNKKIFSIIYIVLSFFVIFNTESKLSLVSFVLIIILSYILYTNSVKNSKKLKNVIIAIVLIGFILLIDTYTNFLSTTIEHFFKLRVSADYFSGRSDIYVSLLRAAKSLPLGGFGSSYIVSSISPHNLFLYILCDYGWLCLVMFVIFMFLIGKKLYSKIMNEFNDNSFFHSLIFSNLLFFAVLSSVSSCNEQRKAIWIFLGICIRIAYENNKKILVESGD